MPTKTFNHSVTVYKELEARAKNATEGKVFEGAFKTVVLESDVPDDYYQRVRDLLGNLGCIRYLRTGHGKQPSLIQLNRAPTVELYNEYALEHRKPKNNRSNEILNGRITDLVRRMDKLEADMRTLMGVNMRLMESARADNDY